MTAEVCGQYWFRTTRVGFVMDVIECGAQLSLPMIIIMLTIRTTTIAAITTVNATESIIVSCFLFLVCSTAATDRTPNSFPTMNLPVRL